MSAICARIRRDDRPADPSSLERLFAAAPHRGALRDHRHDAAAALGCQNIPGAAATSCVRQSGPLTIAFHGRIDNRSDLLRLLPHSASAGAPDDGTLVLHAFSAWREACAGQLIGDFAFIVRDTSRRMVYAARDHIGVKPLYYHLGPREFVAATELGQVIASGVALAPCEPMIAELLAFDVRSRHETLYRDILRLPPGHWMAVTERDVRVRQYWAADPIREIRYGRDDEYAEHFFQLFRTAVADRAPAAAPFATYLSGGLDSSSVVCMARALDRSFETFSLLFPGNPAADERDYIEAVSRRIQAPACRLTVGVLDSERYLSRARARADLPELPSDALGEPLLAAMQSRGLRVAMTGAGGDYGFAGSLLHYADLLQQRDLIGLLRQWRADRCTADVGWTPGQLLSQGVRLMIPAALRRAARPMARRLGWGIAVPPWIAPAFAERNGLLERLNAPRGRGGDAPMTRQHVCELFESGWTARLLESGDRAAAEYGVELRHPFYDRRLVEFAIAIPESQRWRGRTTKFVMREAMRPLLPESVYARMGKADASAYVAHTVDLLGGETAIDGSHIGRLGWIDRDALTASLRDARRQFARGDDAYCDGMFSVWMALAVDAWYRSMFVEDRLHDRLTQRERSGVGIGARGARGSAFEPEALSLA